MIKNIAAKHGNQSRKKKQSRRGSAKHFHKLVSFSQELKLRLHNSSVWLFPILCISMFSFLVVFELSGSSIGMYHKLLYGKTDPSIVYGRAKSIRSDEYLVTAPRAALQSQTNYPAFNTSIGSGRDVVTSPEIPIKDWVGVFRPHNFGYFFLPFANAFAFSWWFGLLLLVIASYFFVLRLLKSRVLAILLSVSFSLSPFILWWYQVGVLLPLAYFFIASILIIRLLCKEKVKYVKSQRLSDLIHALALAYVGVSFGLLTYAPFLIPIAIVLLAFIVGYAVDGLRSGAVTFKRFKISLFYTLAALSVVVLFGVLFYLDRKEMIEAMSNSVYPGQREVTSGHLPFPSIFRFFDSFLMPLLPAPPTGRFYINQSEASNFILLLPFTLIAGVALQIYDYLKNKKLDWTFAFIHITAILLMVRITLPVADSFYKLLLLNKVPNNRLLIGVGLLGFVQLLYLIKNLRVTKISKKAWLTIAAATSLLTLGWLLIFSKYFFFEYLAFERSTLIVLLLGILFTAIISCFLLKREVLGGLLLFGFTIGSSFMILPLQRGLSFFEDSQIVKRVQQVSSPGDSWVVVDNFTFESLPHIAGRKLISGSQPYTDIPFWRQIDKEGKYEDIYNRQAHAIFVSNTAKPDAFLPDNFARTTQDLELVKGNVFKVKFSCSEFTYKNIQFVLTTQQLELPCISHVDKVSYPRATFYIYKVVAPTID